MRRKKGLRQVKVRRTQIVVQSEVEPETLEESYCKSDDEDDDGPRHPKVLPSHGLPSRANDMGGALIGASVDPKISVVNQRELDAEYDVAQMLFEVKPSLGENSVRCDFGGAPTYVLECRKRRRGRGPTLLEDIWNQPDDRKRQVEFNSRGQPIGSEAQLLSSFLGTMIKKPGLMPLLAAGWRTFPQEDKIGLLEIVKSKFVIPGNGEEWVLKSLGKKWKDYKCLVKSKYFEGWESTAEVLSNRPEHIAPFEWSSLVSFWNSNKSKERSAINKISSAKLKMPHTAGTKSFARIIAEKAAKDGVEPSRAELFIETHKPRKDGRPIDAKSACIINAIVDKLKECSSSNELEGEHVAHKGDIFAQVMGPERRGRVRGLGPGVACPKPWDPSISHLLENVLEDRALGNKIVQMLEEEIRKIKENQVKVEAEVSKMKSHLGISSVEIERPSESSDSSYKQDEAPWPVVVLWSFLGGM